MTKLSDTLTIRTSPHIGSELSVDTIMFNVVLALLPACANAVYIFGLAALLVLITSVVSCVLTEHVLCKLRHQATTVGDWSAVITGLLYGMVLPPSLPLWMVFAGGCLAIGFGKFFFGGLGCNPFNPALVGRAFLQAAFPSAMTVWPDTQSRFTMLPQSTLTTPLLKPEYDAISSATPLTDWKSNQQVAEVADLFIGSTGGSTGETSAILLLLGGAYLAARRMLNWRIPVSILTTVGIVSLILHLVVPERCAGPIFMLLSGGLMLGAMFMATDMVGSPLTAGGVVIYGVLIGLLVVLIRVWGGMPEGVMYAILIGNAASPLIDKVCQPRLFGASATEESA